jgi:hypothetical protein
MSKGILVASDHRIEWMLPWWWKHYARYNDFPVAFVDFGMTPKMLKWCQKRGRLLSLKCSKDFIQKKKGLPSEVVQEWQKTYKGNVWQARQAWFKKPLACLQTPFDLTVWMDIDCEVCGSLKPLFEEWQPAIELALVRDERSVEEHNYSSGVILFSKDAPFLQAWSQICLSENGKYMGDQNALTELILTRKVPFKELNPIYNWIMYQGYNVSVVVAHWGSWGKEHIQRFGGLHELLGIKVEEG